MKRFSDEKLVSPVGIDGCCRVFKRKLFLYNIVSLHSFLFVVVDVKMRREEDGKLKMSGW